MSREYSIHHATGRKREFSRITALDERTQRVADAIECCPDAVDLRSIALDAYIDGAQRNIDEINELCHEAADVVKAAHPELGRDLLYLQPYIASQVRGLATGELATLLLPPLDKAN